MLVVTTKESTTIVRVIQRGTMSFNRANSHHDRKERACPGISAVEISQSGAFNPLLAPVPPGVKRSPLTPFAPVVLQWNWPVGHVTLWMTPTCHIRVIHGRIPLSRPHI